MAVSISPNELEMKEEIGEGASAVIHKAIWRNKTVAVKKFHSSCPSSMSKDYEREVTVLSKIDHINIVKLLGYCNQRNNTYLVSELMEGGSLFDYIRNTKTSSYSQSRWEKDLKFIKDITKGVDYLHSNHILHLDLKSLNVLLDKDKSSAKITDFGLSQIFTITSTYTRAATNKIAQGTIRYMACEISKGMKATTKSDVWSFGCILLEFVTREPPFLAIPDNAVFVMLQNDSAEVPLNFDTNTPQVIAAILSKCLVRKPDMRPSFADINDALDKIDAKNLQVTLKTQQIKISSISQNTSVKNTENLKTLLEGIKTEKKNIENNEIKKLNENMQALSMQLNKERLENQRLASANAAQSCKRFDDNSLFENSTLCMQPHEQRLENQRLASANLARFDDNPLLYIYGASLSSPSPQNSTSRKQSGSSTGLTYVSSGSANGSEILKGPRGGLFFENSNGNRRYVQPQSSNVSTGTTYVSNGSANGRAVHTGSRGGQYYLTGSGNKRYI